MKRGYNTMFHGIWHAHVSNYLKEAGFMSKKKNFNMLMYSHDTYGLGHFRRSMAIAIQVLAPKTNTLIITGSPFVGRFDLPEQIDFIRIPGMIKKSNDVYLPLSIKLKPEHAMEIRQQIIKTTAKYFLPHVFLVDKEPLGLKKEVLPTLKWLRKNHPSCRTVLGMRDIMDDADTVREDWKKRDIYEALDTFYDEIWVYGIQEFYDPIREYDIPESVRQKIVFTGYLPRMVPDVKAGSVIRREFGINPEEILVLVTLGGGGDGYQIVDAFLTMLETGAVPFAFKTILITGPFMPRDRTDQINRRGSRLSLIIRRFYRQMEKLISAADIIITMGGYNTLCEILSQKKMALVIPRETPRQEQLIRARVMKQHGLMDFVPWRELSPDALGSKISEMLTSEESIRANLDRFELTGTEVIRQRLDVIRNGHS